jgi:hypothetical protein
MAISNGPRVLLDSWTFFWVPKNNKKKGGKGGPQKNNNSQRSNGSKNNKNKASPFSTFTYATQVNLSATEMKTGAHFNVMPADFGIPGPVKVQSVTVQITPVTADAVSFVTQTTNFGDKPVEVLLPLKQSRRFVSDLTGFPAGTTHQNGAQLVRYTLSGQVACAYLVSVKGQIRLIN